MFTAVGFMILQMTVELRCTERLLYRHCSATVSFCFYINKLSHLQVVPMVVLAELFKEKERLKIQLRVCVCIFTNS